MRYYNVSAGFPIIFTATVPVVELIGGTNTTALMELNIRCPQTSGNFHYGIGRPAARGINPIVSTFFNPENSSNGPSFTKVATTWATAPTAPAGNIFFRRVCLAATNSRQSILFPRGIKVSPTNTLVLYAIAGSNTQQIEVEMIVDE